MLAHRCGGALAPENTLAGLEAAAASGCRGVEFDVMLAADGVPVLIHDETLERTTSGTGSVAAHSSSALGRLDAGSWLDARFQDQRVPTLAQAAARCRALQLAVNLEIKPATGHEAQTGTTAARQAAALWHGQAVPPLLSSFSEVALQAAARAAPQLPRGLLVEALPADWPLRCAQLEVIALHVNADALWREQVAAIRAADLFLVVYTVNDPARAADLLAWGAHCIITDHPERMRHLDA